MPTSSRSPNKGERRHSASLCDGTSVPVFSLIFRMVRDREISEDLAQDTFIKVLNHIDKYRPEFKLSSWLFKIANNVAIDHLRKRQLDTISIDGSPARRLGGRSRGHVVRSGCPPGIGAR